MTTVKDQLPVFPDLVGIRTVINLVAHGTDDWNQIASKHYSRQEGDYAEELATTKMMSLLTDGLIRATGRESQTRKGTAKRWQAQQYRQHSKVRTFIESAFWQNAVFASVARFALNVARNETKEFTDILVVVDDCREHLGEDIDAHQVGDQEPRPATPSNYSTPYIELMWQAIDEFKITSENQPIKETVVEWFLQQKIGGQRVSRSTAEYLASFVRLPESRLGGNRPWKVRQQQTVQ